MQLINLKTSVLFAELLASNLSGSAMEKHQNLAFVKGGILELIFPPSDREKSFRVKDFRLQTQPVTNEEFLRFVRENPEWQRDRISKIFADERYLQHWKTSLSLGDQAKARQPVVFVSWFAAQAYCENQGLRLPTAYEWEFAGLASPTMKNAFKDKSWRERINKIYSSPNLKSLPEVASGEPPNIYGLYDMHSLVWEWVEDFNSTLISSDNRASGDKSTAEFCGAGALTASQRENYPAFLRMAFRSSLQGDFCLARLGFRCASSLIK